MLSIKNLNQYYGESHTLWDINLEVPQGSCICLMGRNGVGKTTLLKTIMGLEQAKSGVLQFENTDLMNKAAEVRAKLGIGYVPQGREIFAQLTVEENLRIGLTSRRDKVREIPERIFEMFPVLKQMLNRRGGDLSGGQQQQLAIGRALAIDPKNPNVHLNVGLDLMEEGRPQDAKRHFLKAIELLPVFPEAHKNLAVLFLTRKPPALAEGLRYLEISIKQDPYQKEASEMQKAVSDIRRQLSSRSGR